MALVRNGEKRERKRKRTREERERDHKNFDNCQVHNITEDLMTFIYQCSTEYTLFVKETVRQREMGCF